MYRKLNDISVKASMILMSNPSDAIKGYTEDIMRDANAINESFGRNVEHRKIMELTGMLDKHPEGWDDECGCKACLEFEGGR